MVIYEYLNQVTKVWRAGIELMSKTRVMEICVTVDLDQIRVIG